MYGDIKMYQNEMVPFSEIASSVPKGCKSGFVTF